MRARTNGASGAELSSEDPMPILRPKPLRHRESLRQVKVAGEFRLSRLCVLMNPILPGAIHPDLAGEMPENNALAAQDCSNGKKEANLISTPGPKGVRTPQLTNRRMRTFIAAPSARNVNSTEEPP